MQHTQMASEPVTAEIARATAKLALGSDDIHLLSESESRSLYYELLSHYVTGPDRRWWWEAFAYPSATTSVPGDDAFTLIPSLVPDPEEPVWFMVEEDQLDHYPIYDTTPTVAEQIIGECYGFEYYLIAKDRRWLLCENHHGALIGIGQPVTSRIEANAA